MPDPILCVAAFVLDPSGRLALIRHARRAWEIPGGKAQPFEPWRSAVYREFKEETGLSARFELAEPMTILTGTPKPGAEYDSLIYVVEGHAAGSLIPGDDAVEARWVTEDEARALPLSDIATTAIIHAWILSR